MCFSSSILLCLAILFSAAMRQAFAATAFSGTDWFNEPFHLSTSSDYLNLYAIRLELYLYQSVGLRQYQVKTFDSLPLINLREIESQLRLQKSPRRFLHLGPTKGNSPGFVVGFPLATELGDEYRPTFALLAARPSAEDEDAGRSGGFPVLTLHGFAKVVDLEKNDVERLLEQVPYRADHVIEAGDVLSMRQVYRKILQLAEV
ncbi:uncharacterized protein SPSC_00079 [Sporisorium scitamineum]|uniref:Uncharacterized protein n=1 Tax=Sporisorium scitamineum TaxID=49012 RepID=A0A127Z6Y6_9BASI|nr:uncharacterized protein SPSC_00079 [Sporisorium scitamineum]